MAQSYSFTVDRDGLVLEGGATEVVEAALAPADLGWDSGDDDDDLIDALEDRIGERTGVDVEDDEGIFDLAVRQGDRLVAVLVVAVEDGAIEVRGERLRDVPQAPVVAALTQWLAQEP